MAPHAVQDRTHFRETLAAVAQKAREKLPESVNGRLESAVKLVLQGDVQPLEDGSIQVGSADPTRYYRLVGTTCTCTDFTSGKAPASWCKHRIAAGLQKRVLQVLEAEAPRDSDTPAQDITISAPLPEAPASLNFRAMVGGFETQITLRDHDEGRLLDRLQGLLRDQRIRPLPTPAPRQGQGQQRRYQGR